METIGKILLWIFLIVTIMEGFIAILEAMGRDRDMRLYGLVKFVVCLIFGICFTMAIF